MVKIKIKVIPNSKKNSLEKIRDSQFKARLTAPAIEGKANKALIEFLAKELNIKKSKIKIILGEKSREKIVEIEK